MRIEGVQTEIDNLGDEVDDNDDDIVMLESANSQTQQRFGTVFDGLDNMNKRIDVNEANITASDARITANSDEIKTNSDGITANNADIAKNKADIEDHDGRITKN